MESTVLAFRRALIQSPLQSVVIGSIAIFALYIVVNEVIRSRSRIPGLAGPKGWPVIGNLPDLWSNAPVKYREWAKIYGDVYQVQLGNTRVVIVNSAAAAKTFLITNSHAMSSRPELYTYHKIASTTAGFTIGSSPYDDSLRRKKKGVAVAMNRPSIQNYIPYLDLETKTFVQNLLDYGQSGTVAIDPMLMAQRLSLSLVMTINWGVRIPSLEDDLLKEIVKVEVGLNKTRSTVGNTQDHIPFLRFNPFNPKSIEARELRARRDVYLAKLDADLEREVSAGTNKPCIQASVIKYKEVELNETELQAISVSMLSGGFETISTTVQWSMALLAQHPEIQDKAYDEIKKFQGSKGMWCDATDDQNCSYILGIAKEALRYYSVLPLALPRRSMKDFEYNGIRIPAGTTLYLNAWACNRDPEQWSDPDVFRPERWQEKPEALLLTFGLGYRMCPAHILATRQLYIILMRLLSSFRLEAPGKIDCDPRTDISHPRDLVIFPKPYRVFFIPRDEGSLRTALAASN
ncbi:cytochrome P450 [Durotheca rogersii]|uniref:cytochrome P450 n=1 Tax=Durotheca rogersii TaxID=419775 RepID=UPI00221E5368|nr:cytochrome P450 [Durotheca rogersii]KAI5862973.1 cytochrome P450 [Durotheca rogersii]